MRAHGNIILNKRIERYTRCISLDMAVSLLGSCRFYWLLLATYFPSASSSAPVDTGLTKVTFSPFQFFCAVRHSSVVKIVLPTSVLAPKT